MNWSLLISSRSRLVAMTLGLVLVVAAVLKGQSLLTSPPTGFLDSLSLNIARVEAELLLGVWLFSGLYPGKARYAALGAFGIFAVAALANGVNGAESCGCFGTVEVSPWPVLCFDLVAAALLWRWQPSTEAVPAERRLLRNCSFAAVSLLTVGSTAFLALYSARPSTLMEDGLLSGDGQVVALAPESWEGRRLPLLPHVDIGQQLGQGTWIVMLYRHDCRACQGAIPAYLALGHDLSHGRQPVRVALVEVPPWAAEIAPQPTGSPCLRGRLSDTRRWQVKTPVFMRVREGRVEVVTSSAALLLENPLSGDGEVQQSAATLAEGLAFPDYKRSRRNRYLVEVACGPLSLLTALRTAGLRVSQSDADDLIAAAGNKGIDLLRLKELAEEQGAHALGVSLPQSEYARIGLPAVIHDGRFGFAVLLGHNADGFRIDRPFTRPTIMSPGEFTAGYGQSVAGLLVSRKPLTARSLGLKAASEEPVRGPRLRSERTVISVGRIYEHSWQATLKLKNVGDADLRITELLVQPRDIKVSVDSRTLAPGTTTTLRISGAMQQLGGFSRAVTLKTNDSARGEVKIPVRGYLEQAVWLDPPAVVLEDARAGRPASAEIGVGLADGFSPDELRLRVPKGAPFHGEFKRGPGGKLKLALIWSGTSEPGWHRHTLEIDPKPSKGHATTPLLVAVRVMPAIQAFPNALWLKDTEIASAWTRTVVVRCPTVSVANIRVSVPNAQVRNAIRVAVSAGASGEGIITLTPRTPGSLSRFKGAAVVLEVAVPGEEVSKVTLMVGDGALPEERGKM